MSTHPTLSRAKAYIEGFLNYHFTDINNLEEALWAYGASLPNGRYLPDGDKSLAVVGDAVLHLVVVNDCYLKGMARGAANDRFKALACNEHLGQIHRAYEIAKFVAMQPGMTEMSQYMRATAVEAILGAVSKDCGGNYGTLKSAVVALDVLES